MGTLSLKLAPTQLCRQPRTEFGPIPFDVIALLKQDNVWSSLPNDLQRFLWALFYRIPSPKHIPNHDPQLIRGI